MFIGVSFVRHLIVSMLTFDVGKIHYPTIKNHNNTKLKLQIKIKNNQPIAFW